MDKKKETQLKARKEFIAQNPEAKSYFNSQLETDLMNTVKALEMTKNEFGDAYLLFLASNKEFHLGKKARQKVEEIRKKRGDLQWRGKEV